MANDRYAHEDDGGSCESNVDGGQIPWLEVQG